MNSGEKLIGNSFFLFADWTATTILSLLYWFIIGKTLPPESYGIIAASVNIMVIVSSFSLVGMQLAVPKFVAEYAETKKYEKMKSLIALSLRIVISISVIFSAAILLSSSILSNLLNLPVEVLIVIALSIAAWSLWSLSTSILLGLQNMKYIFRTNLAGNLLKVVLSFSLIVIGFNYFGPLIGVVSSLVLIVLLRSQFLHLHKGSATINKKSLIMNYGLAAFVTGAVMLLFGNTPSIILNAIKGPAITGLFALAITVSSPLSMVPSTLTQALFPITSALSTQISPKKRQMHLINIITRYALFMTIPAFVILNVFSEKIILIFSRLEYLPAVSLIPIISFATIILGIGGIFNSNIYAIRKPKVSRNIVVLSTGIFFLTVFPLTYMFSAFGAAVSYLSATISYALLSYLYLRKNITLRFSSSVISKLIIANLFFALILYSTKIFDNLLVKILLFALAVFSYFGSLLLMKFYSLEDARIMKIFSEKSPILKRQFARIYKFILDHS